MCDSCWDLDRRAYALKMQDCDGNLTPFMTIEELKSKIMEKWLHTKQTSHVVIKNAIIAPPGDSISWTKIIGPKKKLKFKVTFV